MPGLSSLTISVIIPTYNRESDLKKCIDSLLCQTFLPIEIIIVDDSDNTKTKQLIDSIIMEDKDKSISLLYFKNAGPRSLTKARNCGISKSSGDIIVFLDDDVILSPNYLSEILKVYSDSSVMGVQGYITNAAKYRRLIGLYNKIFFLSGGYNSKCKVLPSAKVIYPANISTKDDLKLLVCDWLSGCNHSYRRIVFDSLKYDDKMIKYSYMEESRCKVFHNQVLRTLLSDFLH